MLYHLIPFRGRDGPRRNADRAQTAVAADRRGTAALILSKGRLMDERIAPLFSPFALRSLRLANRIVMEPMTRGFRSEEHTSELQSLMRISYAVFCLKK